MNEIRWGIIGCGDVTEVKSGPALRKAPGSQLVAVMRRTGPLAEDYARRHHVKKWFDRAEDLIYDPEVDAVYIATPPSSHKEYTLAVAEAGKPVYVEKPMALNYAECREMITACENNGVPLFVAYYRRSLPRFLKVKSLLTSGAIGEALCVNVTFFQRTPDKDKKGIKHWRVDPGIAGGGYFYDLASHSIDLLQYFLGEITTAKGYITNQKGFYKADDSVSAIFMFKTNIQMTGIWNFNTFDDLDRTEIIGDKGKITFSMFADNPVILETKQNIQEFQIDHPQHVQQPLIQTIVNELLGHGKCPSTGYTASKTNWIMDLIYNRD